MACVPAASKLSGDLSCIQGGSSWCIVPSVKTEIGSIQMDLYLDLWHYMAYRLALDPWEKLLTRTNLTEAFECVVLLNVDMATPVGRARYVYNWVCEPWWGPRGEKFTSMEYPNSFDLCLHSIAISRSTSPQTNINVPQFLRNRCSIEIRECPLVLQDTSKGAYSRRSP